MFLLKDTTQWCRWGLNLWPKHSTTEQLRSLGSRTGNLTYMDCKLESNYSNKTTSEYNKEMPQPYTTDQHTAPQGR